MDQIRFLTLNMFLRPPGIHTNASDYKDLRTQILIEEVLEHFDIICLQEVFSTLNNRKDLIISEAARRGLSFSHRSPSPNPFSGHFTDGGLLILSRFPIVSTDEIVFEDAVSADRFSSKGAIYVKLKVNEMNLHVFTTHTQASYETQVEDEYLRYRIVRRNQIKQLRLFIDRKLGFMYEPIIVAGDFNVDARESLKKPVFGFERQDDYNHFWNILSDSGCEEIADVVLMKYEESLATFGIVDKNGEGIEKVLTGHADTALDMCLDYILVLNHKALEINIESIKVDPFQINNQPVTQLSDHAGIKFSFTLLKTNP